jgi:hypothetical protein
MQVFNLQLNEGTDKVSRRRYVLDIKDRPASAGTAMVSNWASHKFVIVSLSVALLTDERTDPFGRKWCNCSSMKTILVQSFIVLWYFPLWRNFVTPMMNKHSLLVYCCNFEFVRCVYGHSWWCTKWVIWFFLYFEFLKCVHGHSC